MSINDHAEVLAFTKGLSRPAWLAIRKQGIGGSDAASILGVSRWTSAFALWADKIGASPDSDNGNAAMTWGNDLELPVAQHFAREHEAAVVAYPAVLRSKANPFMLANVDFFVVEPSELTPAGVVTDLGAIALDELPEIFHILEIKTTGITGRPSREWDDESVPRSYELQGQHYSIVTGIQSVVFAALVAGTGLVVRGRLYNGEEENAALVEAESHFFQQVARREPPEPDGSDSSAEAIKSLYPESTPETAIEADDFSIEIIDEYLTAKADLDALEIKVKGLKAKIEVAIGANEILTWQGTPIATYKSTKSRAALDQKAVETWLAENNPEILKSFTVTKPGYRVLRFMKVRTGE